MILYRYSVHVKFKLLCVDVYYGVFEKKCNTRKNLSAKNLFHKSLEKFKLAFLLKF